MAQQSKSTPETQRHALILCDIGREQLQKGMVEAALETFDESLSAHPTAEAHTCRGWALSFQGSYMDAINDCLRAIRLDEGYGDPYNDIGVYMIKLGRLDKAVSWLKRAKAAARYERRHFPYLNLGHIYTVRGRTDLALNEYVRALELDPDNSTAKAAIAAMPL